MSGGTDRARELLASATDGPWSYDCLTVKTIRRWMRRHGAQRPEADTDLATRAPGLLSLAIKQHEALRAEHLYVVNPSPLHFDAVQRRDYTVADTCRECAVLLMWERMWEEKQ